MPFVDVASADELLAGPIEIHSRSGEHLGYYTLAKITGPELVLGIDEAEASRRVNNTAKRHTADEVAARMRAIRCSQ